MDADTIGRSFTLDHVWGFAWSMKAMRFAHKSVSDSDRGKDLIGPTDYELARTLVSQGPSHSKFLRSIVAWATIKAPRYWWQQWATYHFSVELSESTHHTILKSPLTKEDFVPGIFPETIDHLNLLIAEKGEIGGTCWKDIKSNLPEGYLQTRAIVTNYQTLRTAYHQRKSDPLEEWRMFERWVSTLPYSVFIVDWASCNEK